MLMWEVPTTPSNGPVRQPLLPTSLHPTLTTVLPSSNTNLKKKDEFASDGIVPEPQTTSDYSTTPQETLNNFSYSTGMIVSKLSCRALHRLHPLTTPCGKEPSN
jgi:hypothetical protein